MAELRDHKYQEQWEKQIRSDPEVLKDLLGAAFLINTEARRDGTRAVMSHPQLAEYLGVSVSTAQRHIRRLRELGYLELVERGHRRGDGTVTANVYKLTLRFTVDAPAEAEVDPWASPMDDSLQVTQMTDRDPLSAGHLGDLLSEVSTGQIEVSTGQNEVSTGQNEVSTGHPGDRPLFNPSLNPSQIPHASDSPSAGETTGVQTPDHPLGDSSMAVAQSQPEARPSSRPGLDGFGNGKKQDQKRLEEELQCSIRGCGQPQSRHDRWMAMLDADQRHPFEPPTKQATRPRHRRRRTKKARS
jgi:DNA-binding transcriptional ArsR family regulator